MSLLRNRNVLVLSLPLFLLMACGGGKQKESNTDSTVIRTAASPKAAVHPVVVEVIIAKDKHYNGQELADAKGLRALAKNVDVVVWKNRLAIYGLVPNANEFADYIKKAYHGTFDSLKVFEKPFYKFNRSQCADTVSAKEWTNIYLSANLVADASKQQEYLNYHKTQFEKWPEVSKGFCNASFQQLLVFKQGRQLMLVISIPKGKTLDELNPLTTKNNPRVDEWNKLMSKYQEGLPGTKKGETWVFFK